MGEEINSEVTHVVAPERTTTLKTFLAALSSIWIVPPRWLNASLKAGTFLSESEFGGIRGQPNRLHRQRFFLHGSLLEEFRHRGFPLGKVSGVLERGGGSVCSAMEEATVILVHEGQVAAVEKELKKNKASASVQSWEMFRDGIVFGH